MATAFLAVGLVLVVEGLVWALAPSSVEAMLAALRDLPTSARRLIGLIAVTAGVAFVMAARALGT